MKGSFVLVNYNRRNELLLTIEKTLEAISYAPREFEIVVVDNASSDGSAQAVRERYPQEVVLVENPVNTGAPAWNLGFAQARGEYFIIIDDDSHVESGLREAIAYMDAHEDIGILALNVVSGPYTSGDWGWKNGQELVGFIGCGAIYRKAVYDKIGGYADWIFLYANEWDLGIRCVDAGYKVEYFARCTVNHRASKVNRTSKRLRVLATKHELGVIYKHFAHSRWKYLIRVMLNNLKPIGKGEFKGALYNTIGFFEFLKMRKSLPYTPISPQSQRIYLNNYAGTQFVLGFARDLAYKILKRDKSNMNDSITIVRPLEDIASVKGEQQEDMKADRTSLP